MIKRDKEYFRRLHHFKNIVESYLKRTGQSINKYKVVAMVSVLLDESYKVKYDSSKQIHLDKIKTDYVSVICLNFLEDLHTVSRNVVVFRFN